MFERYTEKARRVIFFARYEASNYGSRYIETEHVLLGLVREERAPLSKLLGTSNLEAEIRAEIDKRVTRGERISTSVEMPLSTQCKNILRKAAEEAERLGHRYVGTEHILLGILGEKGTFAAEILQARGLKPQTVREQLAKAPLPRIRIEKTQATKEALATLESFLAGLKWHKAEELTRFFARNA